MKLYTEQPEDEQFRPGEIHLHIRFRPANMLGILFVLLMHGLLLYYLLHLKSPQKEGNAHGEQNPIVLMLNQAETLKIAKAEPQKAQSKPQVVVKQNKVVAQPKRALIADAATPSPAPETVAPQGMDMSSMLNAARERRRLAEESAAQENRVAQQGSHGLSPQEVAEANVKRSMQQANGRQGTNGVFQIISKSTRMASFSFRGWNPGNTTNSWRQVIEVDAGLGGDVELAIVRRMIELIRTHYKGDFSWESQRLGRVVSLSARPQDSADLERFMMKEFFGNAG
ncbi:hypothetical protein EJG51_011260 [Undibacterium piscinae]|uniref:Uncharacterized protein n=1 Tax=Undibacterium piscinae TaxID=2495591 RepID=A0A6M4A8G9_9BURK|nr:hypothetical protein EJG51_011260 [Undibacterium piscinae]